MEIVEYYGSFYAFRTGTKPLIEYLQEDGSWGKRAEYFRSREALLGVLEKHPNCSVSPAENFVQHMENAAEVWPLWKQEVLENTVKIGVSNFAKSRHVAGTGKSYFNGLWDELIQLVRDHWNTAVPGQGETDLKRKIVVSVPCERFVGTTATLKKGMELVATVDQRQDGEDVFVAVKAVSIQCPFGFRIGKDYDKNDMCNTSGCHAETYAYCRDHEISHDGIAKADPVVKAEIVLYSREALTENVGESSGDFDWEVVAILAKTNENEPMTPLTMARNFLEKPGGTKSVYTAQEFAEAVYFWSQRVSI
jgi:hypothetical protein